MTQTASTAQAEPLTSAGAWDLRHPGCIMRGANGEEIHEFLGMWPLKPDADLVGLRDGLSREGAPFWAGPGKTFSEATTMLGLIRTARWFVGTSTEFGPTLYFVSQFDSSLEKYFDDFVLNGKTNLEKIWGTCIGCPTGPDATARDIVQYVARGRSRPWSVYDALPSLQSRPDPEDGRLVPEDAEVPARGLRRNATELEDKVNAFFSDLAKLTNSCRAVPTSTPT